MISLLLVRDDQNAERTMGKLTAEGLSLFTLELPWKQNVHNISCIPEGRYSLSFTWSQRHQKFMWHICGVPGRDAIEIHVGNTIADVLGCVAVGKARQADSISDSVVAYTEFLTYMKPYQEHGGFITIQKAA